MFRSSRKTIRVRKNHSFIAFPSLSFFLSALLIESTFTFRLTVNITVRRKRKKNPKQSQSDRSLLLCHLSCGILLQAVFYFLKSPIIPGHFTIPPPPLKTTNLFVSERMSVALMDFMLGPDTAYKNIKNYY